ncbi:flagellar assembly protein FliH [Buchnera aphidicola (Hyadaphis tataricae)]|uniref:Flagellar assembly protein FliH n=1 Tax=Buchnera aphidicola (Hyadaphis tataricae) TaxID=1241859 RepID=A0A4D6XYW2_9GAMM|nr:FliH/SctL family protein [Buchnera aphidicola]QCI21397.1 flagellar assembly protein FliH [Buchnera aphidicola (Hyadaphis tataricae)]
MSSESLKKKWTKWYPKKISLKNTNKNKFFLSNVDQFNKEDFHLFEKKKTILNESINNDLQLEKIKNISYQKGFETGLLEGKQDQILLKKTLNNFFLECDKHFVVSEYKLYNMILKILSHFASYLIGKKINVDQSYLKDNIKKILQVKELCLNNIIITAHPSNKNFIENTFQDCFKSYKWQITYDDKIDKNGFKIKSQNSDSNIDATVEARWQELRRLIDLEDY